VQIFRVAIGLLYVVTCAFCIPNDVTGPSEGTDLSRSDREGSDPVGRDLLFPTPRLPHPRAISELSRVGLRSSLAQSPDSGAPPQSSTSSDKHPVERGYAAFYSASLEGHKTACGGVYSPSQLTAAHPTLRCGTRLRVTNLRNGKSVRVTVNDHLPASRDRILDLSYAAAQALDFILQGTTLVKIEVLR
jgi:rare lipoprotein A